MNTSHLAVIQVTDGLIHFLIFANVISAMCLIWFMQAVTAGAGWRCPLALLLAFHRGCYLATVVCLAVSAYCTYNAWTPSPLATAMTSAAWMILCLGSFLRHRLAVRIPPGATWHDPAYSFWTRHA